MTTNNNSAWVEVFSGAAFETEVVDPIFDDEHQNCRWHIFRHYDSESMYKNMMDNVFPFIKSGLGEGKDTAYAKDMDFDSGL